MCARVKLTLGGATLPITKSIRRNAIVPAGAVFFLIALSSTGCGDDTVDSKAAAGVACTDASECFSGICGYINGNGGFCAAQG